MNTPFKPISKFESINQLFPHHSEAKKASKNLFQALTQIESPKFTPVMAQAYSTREPYTDQKSLYFSNIKEPMNQIGCKRMNSTTVKNLEKSLAQENFLGYQTPLHTNLNHKRPKIEYNGISSEKKDFNLDQKIYPCPEVSASDEEKDIIEGDDGDDDKRSVNSNRKKRGLKILSVKVQELVFKK